MNTLTIKATSSAGYGITLTLADDDTKALMKRGAEAEHWLAQKGYAPTLAAAGAAEAGNGNGDGNKKYCDYKNDTAGYCPTHGKALKPSKHHSGYYCPARA